MSGPPNKPDPSDAQKSRVTPVFDLSIRTFEEAAQLNGCDREDVMASGAGGGGAAFKGQIPTFRPGFGKSLTTTEVSLGAFGTTPIKRAAMTHLCFLCTREVIKGEEIWPVLKPEGPGVNLGGKKSAAHCWCHLECARAHAPDGRLSTPVCPHWLKKGSCAFGAVCFYDHPENLVAQIKVNPNEPKRVGTWKRRVTRKSGKASIFRRWLIDTFGLALLSSGSGILDVAGGKGELAFELVNLNRIPTTVVDPRPLDLSSYRRKFEFGIYWRNPLSHTYIHPHACSDSPVTLPMHLRIFFDQPFLEAIAEEGGKGEVLGTKRGAVVGRGGGGGREGGGEKEEVGKRGGGVEAKEEREVGGWKRLFCRAVEQGHEVVWTKKGLIAKEELTPANAYPSKLT
jgi:hypothetical protein